MRTHKVNISHCPNCDTGFDGATGLNTENEPGPGDILICIDCKEPSMLQEDGSRRFLSDAEMVELRRQLTKMGSR